MKSALREEIWHLSCFSSDYFSSRINRACQLFLFFFFSRYKEPVEAWLNNSHRRNLMHYRVSLCICSAIYILMSNNYCTIQTWSFLPLFAAFLQWHSCKQMERNKCDMMMMMTMMMMTSTFISHDSINLNAQCTEGGGGGGGGDEEKVMIIKKRKRKKRRRDTWCKVTHRTGGFSDVRGSSLIWAVKQNSNHSPRHASMNNKH